EIYRSIHTLKGNANALGLQNIGATTHKFESFLDELRANPETFDKMGPEVLFQQIEPLQHLFARLGGHGDPDPVATAPDINLSEIPEEIRLIFLEESTELLALVSHHLLDLEQGDSTLEHALEETYRAIHTLKGNANALGLGWIGESAHTMESLLSNLRDKPESYGPAATEALFRHLEVLRRQASELQDASDAEQEPVRQTDPLRTTGNIRVTKITQERTPQQVVEAVRRDKSLFDEFEKRVSDTRRPIDSRTTGELKIDKAGSPAPAVPSQAAAAVDETIRVSIGKVDKLINLADELLISRISFDQHVRTLKSMVSMFETAQQQMRMQLEQVSELDADSLAPFKASLNKLEAETNQLSKGIRKDNAAFGLLVDEIQYNARSTRMLPAAYLLNPLRLVMRNTSAKLQKKVQLSILGEEIEMDRLLIERLKDPLGHLLRNAIDHGIESPDQRQQLGKNPEARVTIAISVAGNMIRFQLHDDGRGLDYEKIRAKAVKLGMIGAEMASQLTEHDLNNLLFQPGFTTTEHVTDISGRGVGLDVVKATLDSLNGTIEIVSNPGRGTIFTLLVPVTLTTFDAFVVELSGQTFAMPRSLVLATLTVTQKDVTDSGVSKAIFYDDQPVRLVSLQQLLGLPPADEEQGEFAVMVVESGQQRLALMVDSVLESQQMVMKNLGSQLKKVMFVSGATVLGSGEPVVVLNLTEIVAHVSGQATERMSVMVSSQSVEATSGRRKGKTRVLVVDDSVTTRTLEKNILEAAGFEVVIAKNGREGQNTVIQEMPHLDLIITDVEMPQMNGFEFASWVKLESEYRHTPVIMVTSLASPEFKAKGFASGIDAYIVKSEFNQQNLLDTIAQLLVSA
ncbi:MAG: response regulator, partial [Candidatus Sericytochromatia bacterium]